MKSVVNYSINVEVLKAFNEEVDPQTRSRLIEALMIEFLVKYSREKRDILPESSEHSNANGSMT